MIGENRQLVADEPVEFEKEPVEGELPLILEEFIEYTPILWRKPEDVNM